MIIVHLGPAVLPVTYNKGGAIQRRMLEMATLQAARGHRVILYSADSECGRMDHHGVEIRSLVCGSTGYVRDLRYLKKALRDLRNQHIDVLHFHSLPEGAVFCGGIARKTLLSYDYFAFRRGKKTPLFWFYRRALRRFSQLLPVSEHCWHGSKDYWDLDGIPAHVLHNGVNLEQFRPDCASGMAKRRALGIGAERIILYMGRVCAQKGTDLLIRAVQRLRREYPSTRRCWARR